MNHTPTTPDAGDGVDPARTDEPYVGLATALLAEAGPTALDEDEALALFHAQLTLLTRYSVHTRVLEPWDTYERLLADYVDEPARRDLRVLWDFAHREQYLRGDREPQPRRYPPIVPTAMYELRAETTAEFLTLLHTLITRSGVSIRQIGERCPNDGPGKLHPSQLYSLLNRGALPRIAAQVRSIGEACGLDEHQTQQLLRLWATLHQARRHTKRLRSTTRPDPHPDIPDTALPATSALRHRPRHQPDGLRAATERWFDRAERQLHTRSGWAPPEPTTTRAVNEAAALTHHLHRRYTADDTD